MTVETFVCSVIARGVTFEPVGDKLRVNPVEKLGPSELETIREYRARVLLLAIQKSETLLGARGVPPDVEN